MCLHTFKLCICPMWEIDSAKEFMTKNGIAENRIIAKGYGESQPIVKCKTEESCTEEDHEWNRRCELVVVQWE